MKQSLLEYAVSPLKEMLNNYLDIIYDYKKRESVFTAGLSCIMLPPEIPAAFGFVTLRMPTVITHGDCSYRGGEYCADSNPVFDYYIIPDKCCSRGSYIGNRKVYVFRGFEGYGREASALLHNELTLMLKTTIGVRLNDINTGKLKSAVCQYNLLRRLVRGISANRQIKPYLLSNADLHIIFEAAAAFPPVLVTKCLNYILDEMNSHKSLLPSQTFVKALLYAGIITAPEVLDEMETVSFIIAEDDYCGGRRQFDISLNHESDCIYDEILDSFSYRPLCSCQRKSAERHELLYKMLRSREIECVVFFEDGLCKAGREAVDFHRTRIMRSGVDPVVVNRNNCTQIINEYLKYRIEIRY